MPGSPKILIVADNASTVFGGEAILPVHYFRILKARGHPVQMIAHHRNRTDLEAYFDGDLTGLHFIEDTAWHRAIWRAGSVFPQKIQENLFGILMIQLNERLQARLIRRLIAGGQVDLIHQPIPVSPKAPSSIYGFGVPVVIGPMNGGMAFPEGYEDYESRVSRRFTQVARRVAVFMNRLIPGKHRAAALLVANARTRAALPCPNHPTIITLVENGVDLSTWQVPENPSSTAGKARTFRVVFMGRLVDWKAVPLTLEALGMARAAGTDVTLDILGDGAERPHLENLVREKLLCDAVQFHGFLPQAECARFLSQSDALILNSLYECGGAVVLEAMSLGIPVIGSDWGGPADYIDETCGILVSPVPRANFTERLTEAIVRLAAAPELRHRMGIAGQRKVRKYFDWDKKVDFMLEVYAEAIARHQVGTKQ